MASHDIEFERRIATLEAKDAARVSRDAEMQVVRDAYLKSKGAGWLLMVVLPFLGGFMVKAIERLFP
jgi:hypothetical protein